MKRYSVKISWKRLKRIPKSALCPWLIFGLLSLYLLVQLILPTYRTLDDLQEYEIHIDRVFLLDSHDTKGNRMKLEIVDGDRVFYLWYPQFSYGDYRHDVETELLTGKVTSVMGKIPKAQKIRDNLFNRTRIVDLRNGDSVYYDLATEKASLRHNHNTLWIPFLLIFASWLFTTLYISLIYQIVTFQKK